MVTRGRLSIHLQKAPKLSKEWGEGQLAAGVGLISVKECWFCPESLDK
jgi:hypothetical protein